MQSSSGNNSSGGGSASGGNRSDQVEDSRKIIKITAMAHSNTDNCPSFLVQWENKRSKKWVSLFNIQGGLEHKSVEEYRLNNPDQFRTVMEQAYLERRSSKRGATKKQNTATQKKAAPPRPADKPKNINQHTQWIVREITDIRIVNKIVQLYTTWDACGTKEWRALKNFDNGFDHPSIQEFAEKYPNKFNQVLEHREQVSKKKSEQSKSRNKSIYIMEELEDDDPEFKEPEDPGMEQELLALYNTRLRSDHDELLSAISGSERVSRSRAREMRGPLHHTASSTSRLPLPSRKRTQAINSGNPGNINAKPSAPIALMNAITQQSEEKGEKMRKLIDPTTSDEEEERLTKAQGAKRRRFYKPKLQQVEKPTRDKKEATQKAVSNSHDSSDEDSSDSSDDDSNDSSDDQKPGILDSIYAKVKAASERKLNPNSSNSVENKKKATQRNSSSSSDDSSDSDSNDSSDADSDDSSDEDETRRQAAPTSPPTKTRGFAQTKPVDSAGLKRLRGKAL